MRTPPLDRRFAPPLTGILVGCVVASVLVVGGTAVAQRSQSEARAVLEATHLPPQLTLPAERVDLAYDVHCARGGVEDPEENCDASGTVYLRGGERDAFRPLPLEPTSADGLRRLTLTVPSGVIAAHGGFEYYAELRTADGADSIFLPPGGADAPHRTLLLGDPVGANLGVHSFGATDPGIRIASAPWGDGTASVGLEPNRTLPAIGASAFDVSEDGTVTLLDEAHRRALRWRSDAGPTRVSLSIDGRLADLSIGDDGSIYVLESVAAPGRTPLVRHFDPEGHELDVVETAEPGPSQLRIGPNGPVVLQRPSNQWMPVADRRGLLPTRDQRRNGRTGRPLRSGAEVIALRREREILVALVSNRRVERSWRIRSGTPLGEIQLAEPLGRRFVVVARVYTDAVAEFVVIVLDRHGVVTTFSTPSDEWAEATPLGRFRIAGHRLYRLGSSASGVFVARYDLEGT